MLSILLTPNILFYVDKHINQDLSCYSFLEFIDVQWRRDIVVAQDMWEIWL